MAPSSAVRVGLIGCGNIGARGHAPAYKRIAEATLVAACDIVPEHSNALAVEYEIDEYTDYRRLLERDDIDMVDLCVPTYLHASLAVEALEWGKHVLCEKPIARNLTEADAMIKTARKTGLKLMVGHVRRFDHRYVEINKAITSGEIGAPVYIRRAERQWLPFPASGWHWRPEMGGGVILDIGVHIADLFRWLYSQNPVSVYAVGRKVRQAAREADSFDHVFITYTFPNGAVGLAEASWAYPPDFGAGLYASLDVVGTLGKIQFSDQESNPMLVFDQDTGAAYPRYFQFMSTTEYAFEEEIRHFVDCLLEDSEPTISLADARAALEMVVAAQQSARIGQPIPIPFDEANF